jgi:hypothetical protein
MNGGSGGSGGAVQTGSIANQTILYNVTTSQDNVISGLNLSSNKWGVTVVEEWNSGSVPGDIFYPSCSLLMHFSGSNDSTTFIDNSPNNFAITSSNGAKITSSISKFGGTSGFFDGTNDYLTIANNSGFDFGSGNFTIEYWEYRTVSTLYKPVLSRNTSGYPPFMVGWSEFGNVNFFSSADGASWNVASAVSMGTLTTNVWTHYAVTRQGNTFRTFQNGTQISTFTSTATLPAGAGTLLIGGYATPAYFFQGYIDEIRITKGVARYTGSFVTQSAEFYNNASVDQYATKYIGLVGGLNDSSVDYGVEKLSDSSLKIRKMTASGQPLSGSGELSASVDRVYVNVLNYKEVQTTAQSASYAVSSSYAITSSYLTGGSQILTSDRTVAFSSSFTTAQIQSLIDAQPKNLNGYSITFQFADGNYNLSTGLQFNFFSNGVLLIYGNSSNNTVAAAKNVTLSGSAPIYLGQNNTTTEVNYLRLAINTSTYASALAVENTNTLVNYCSFTNYPTSVVVGSGNGIGAQARSAVWVRNSYFTSLDRYMVSLYNGIITADTNSQGTNSNIAYLAYGGIIQVQNTGLTGTTTYSTSVGGLIVRPSGTTVGT